MITGYITAVRNVFSAIEVTNYSEQGKTFVSGEAQAAQLPTLQSGRELLDSAKDAYVPFWTGGEDSRNQDAENVIIEHLLVRPNTLSLRDVRDYNIAWSVEIVGKRARDVQHVRILCDQESAGDILNLPYEVERINPAGDRELIGWGEHPGIDYLVFFSVKAQMFRMVHRHNYATYLLQEQQRGTKFRLISRQIPKDVYKRAANGLLVPIADLEQAGNIILETGYLHADPE